ncbi:hypothetical protein LZ32DRAFT_614341 [Colletotrichum eremochloae]|nr:hypothetical protein LZ32DRAFT_614341 [Colletotrichum eremochloae]
MVRASRFWLCDSQLVPQGWSGIHSPICTLTRLGLQQRLSGSIPHTRTRDRGTLNVCLTPISNISCLVLLSKSYRCIIKTTILISLLLFKVRVIPKEFPTKNIRAKLILNNKIISTKVDKRLAKDYYFKSKPKALKILIYTTYNAFLTIISYKD